MSLFLWCFTPYLDQNEYFPHSTAARIFLLFIHLICVLHLRKYPSYIYTTGTAASIAV